MCPVLHPAKVAILQIHLRMSPDLRAYIESVGTGLIGRSDPSQSVILDSEQSGGIPAEPWFLSQPFQDEGRQHPLTSPIMTSPLLRQCLALGCAITPPCDNHAPPAGMPIGLIPLWQRSIPRGALMCGL